MDSFARVRAFFGHGKPPGNSNPIARPDDPPPAPTPVQPAPTLTPFQQWVNQGLGLPEIMARLARGLSPDEMAYYLAHSPIVPVAATPSVPVSPDPTPAAPIEDRFSGIVDRAGGVRYWRAAAGQEIVYPVVCPVGKTITIDCLGEAPAAGPRVERFKFWASGPTGDITPRTDWGTEGTARFVVTGPTWVHVVPVTTGAGYFEIRAIES